MGQSFGSGSTFSIYMWVKNSEPGSELFGWIITKILIFLEQPKIYSYDIDNSGEIDKSEMFYVLKVEQIIQSRWYYQSTKNIVTMMNAVNIFLIMMSVTRVILCQNHGASYRCNSYNDDLMMIWVTRVIVFMLLLVNIFNGWRQHWGRLQKKHIVASGNYEIFG